MSNDNEYRFFVNEHDGNGTPTIYRAELSKQYDDGGDAWQFYWYWDQMVAVYDDPSQYTSPTSGEWTDRAEQVIERCREYDQDVDAALNRLAIRLFDHEAPNAQFIAVHIERGTSLYALSWDGDPDHTWRNEIEAVYHGDVWRVEAEEWDGEGWGHADFDGNEWYGESVARAAFQKEYPLTEFPAHLTISEQVGA